MLSILYMFFIIIDDCISLNNAIKNHITDPDALYFKHVYISKYSFYSSQVTPNDKVVKKSKCAAYTEGTTTFITLNKLGIIRQTKSS